MEALIEVASNAGRILLNPYILIVVGAFVLALVTGLAARITVFTEDMRYVRSHRTVAPDLAVAADKDVPY